MKQVNLIVSLLLCISLLLSTGCATISGFSTGRTVEKGGGEVSANVTYNQTPDLTIEDTISIIPTFRVPFAELGVRYGVLDKLDLGLSANTLFNFFLDAKYQFVGDQESSFAMATGLGLGVLPLTAIGVTVFKFQVPLYISFHPSEKIHVYLSPRYIYQYGTGVSKFVGNLNYTGFNAGVMFGDEFKFGFDIANYRIFGNGGRVGQEFEKKNLFNAGIGMSFSF